MKGCNRKKGVTGYRVFLCVLLVVVLVGAVWYCIESGKSDQIPADGTLVEHIREDGRKMMRSMHA